MIEVTSIKYPSTIGKNKQIMLPGKVNMFFKHLFRIKLINTQVNIQVRH